MSASTSDLFGVEVPAVPSLSKRSGERVTLSDVRRLFFDGSFERCLARCDAVRVAEDAVAVELGLLRARCLLRLDQPDKAIDILGTFAHASLSNDEYVTSQMLLGAAYVRIDQVERGLAILEAAQVRPESLHPTIAAELSVNLGIAYYRLGQFDVADRQLSAVGEGADIVHARALEYLGWLAFGRGLLDRAADTFRLALRRLDECRHRDRFIEANVIQGLASVCPELLRADDWPEVEARIRSFDWSASGLDRPHFWTAMCASMMCEIRGELEAARYWVRHAERIMTAAAYRVLAHCRMAAILRASAEQQGRFDFISRAQEAYEEVSHRELTGDMRFLPLYIADELTYAGANDEAVRLVRRYRAIVPAASLGSARTPGTALEDAVGGALCENAGNADEAMRRYTRAFEGFDRSGYRRRACVVALRLAYLTGEQRYVEYLHNALSSAPKYWLTVEFAKLEKKSDTRLSPAQWHVLHLVAEGKTYKEIAALRGGSWRTVRNLVHGLFRRFGVRSKGELVAVAMRRGLLHRVK